MRRDPDGKCYYSLSNAPDNTPLTVLARRKCQRFFIERTNQDAKSEFGFGVLVGALDKEALALASCQDGERGVVGRVAEGIVTFTIRVPAHDQPLDRKSVV